MQCKSFVPVYYYVRNLNAGTNDFSWPIFNGDISLNRRSCNVSLPSSSVDQYLGYDKEVLGQIMIEHEATFRLQVQELHRLYERQKELMGEIREREFSMQHVQLHTSESYPYSCRVQSDTTHRVSHTPSWLFGNSSDIKLYSLTEESFREPPPFVAEKTVKGGASPSLTKNSSNELEILSSQIKRSRKKILDLELPADVYNDDKEGEKFEEGNIMYSAPKKFSDIEPESDLKLDSVKPAYSSSSNLSCTKINCLIDLNEPVQLESLSSSSTGHFETDYGDMEIVHHNQDVKPHKGSSGVNYSGLIDLNSMPLSLSKTTIALENTRNIEEETKLEDSNGRAESDAVIVDQFSTLNTDIDLNSHVTGDEPSQAVPNRGGNVVEIDLKSSSRRKKSEKSQLETPSFLPDRDGEPFWELDRIAADTLIMISSSEVQLHLKSGSSEPLDNSNDRLYWFAGILSSMGGKLLHEVEKPQKVSTHDYHTEVSHDVIDDFESMALKPQRGHGNYFCQNFREEKEAVDTKLSGRPSKGRARGTRQLRKDFQVEVDLHMDEGLLRTGSRTKSAVRKTCAKQRKYSKLSTSNPVKKSVSSILKQPDTCSKQGFLETLTGWGKMKKRRGGQARKTHH